ncbi:membrane protein insertase YidC [Spongiactinospora sp. TRM90649]|uniref:YidC/Oxa1 family membrane protein insertase n=1 Tax=Spongiactinospora sp. TRM90649 TaxID=3031114 RepID=UPI0023F81B12|nr:membrane protein insertase YidC [Spongiactinospora sp. TRM90649]MDF5752996.1 membrane protein insertase YidC [Spongiactinospora sp. TRM90649]
MFDGLIGFTGSLLAGLADIVSPVAGANATALAIVLFTLAVRVLLLPLTLRAARGERIRQRLAPQVGKLRKRHRHNPEKMAREVRALYAKEGGSPFSGVLPSFAQMPFFMLLFQVASQPSTHTLFGAPLGAQVASVVGAYGPFGVPVLVFAAVIAMIAGVAWVSSRRAARAAEAVTDQPPLLRKIMPLMPFGAVLAALFLPLAAALYLLATTAWSAAERALLFPKPATA